MPLQVSGCLVDSAVAQDTTLSPTPPYATAQDLNMFGLRQRISAAKSTVPLVVIHQDAESSEECMREAREMENSTAGKGEQEGDMLYSDMRQSFSSISDADASQTSEEADEDEAVSPPLAVKTGMTPASEMEDGGINRVESPESLDNNADIEEKPERPRARRATRSASSSFNRRDSTSSSTGTWLGLDASIIIALISPIGNLLTGGDHVKNLLLLALLIYYLHQLVEGLVLICMKLCKPC